MTEINLAKISTQKKDVAPKDSARHLHQQLTPKILVGTKIIRLEERESIRRPKFEHPIDHV